VFIQKVNVITAALATIVIAGSVMGTAAAQEREKGKGLEAKIEQPAWGKTLKGLRLGLCPTEPKGDGKPRLTIVFENVGKEDFVLYLGDSYAQGKKHWLDTVRLHLTDVDGRKRALILKGHERDDERDGALVTLLITQLVTDGRYVISRDLSDFYDPEDVDAVLPAGKYRARVEFVGEPVTKSKDDTNLASVILKGMHYWTGSIQSDECQVTLPAKPAR